MIVAIDFDGTIVENKFPQIGQLLPEAKECINALCDAGHYIIIWTCRCDDNLLNAINFLLENEIKFHRVNDNHPQNTALYGGNSRKVYAHMYIDDKNAGGLRGWAHIKQEVEISEAKYLMSKT